MATLAGDPKQRRGIELCTSWSQESTRGSAVARSAWRSWRGGCALTRVQLQPAKKGFRTRVFPGQRKRQVFCCNVKIRNFPAMFRAKKTRRFVAAANKTLPVFGGSLVVSAMSASTRPLPAYVLRGGGPAGSGDADEILVFGNQNLLLSQIQKRS